MIGVLRRLFLLESAIRDQMMSRDCLLVVCEPAEIRIEITDAQFAHSKGYQEIVASLPNYSPAIERWQSYSWWDKYYLFDRGLTNLGYPVWVNPLIYNREDEHQDVAAFDALFVSLGSKPVTLSLAELAQNAESAFIETRPSDFDWRGYYA